MSYQLSPRLKELRALRPGLRNLTTEGLISHLHGRYEEALASIPAWETVELHVPKRDSDGRYVKDSDGLVVTELKRISKQAQKVMPILDAIESVENDYIQFLETWVDESTARRMYAEIGEALKAEGWTSASRDPEYTARHDELMAAHTARNRVTVAALLATARAKRDAPAVPAEAAPKAKAAKAAA